MLQNSNDPVRSNYISPFFSVVPILKLDFVLALISRCFELLWITQNYHSKMCFNTRQKHVNGSINIYLFSILGWSDASIVLYYRISISSCSMRNFILKVG